MTKGESMSSGKESLVLAPVEGVLDASSALARLAQVAAEYVDRGQVESTRAAYESDWRHFGRWCEAHGVPGVLVDDGDVEPVFDPRPVLGSAVALYVADLADRGFKNATISRRLATIAQLHAAGGYPNPCGDAVVKAVWKGVRKRPGGQPDRATPLRLEDIAAMVDALGDDPKGVRDRALLLVGFATSLRRSELVGLDVEDVTFNADYAIAIVRQSKTDKSGQGQKVVIPRGRHRQTCPLAALRAWLDIAQIASGPIFRGVDRHGNVAEQRLSGRGVERAVKAAAVLAGVDGDKLTGHSLRRGHVTTADSNGASRTAIKKQTRHSQDKMIDLYTEDREIVTNNSAFMLGL
jgi:integrase